MDQLLEWFHARYETFVIEIVVPHARIKQMSHRVFRSTDIQIDRQPVFQKLLIGKFFVVSRIDISQEIVEFLAERFA